MKDVSLNNGRALHPPNIAATLRVNESIATSAQQTDVRTENRLRKVANRAETLHTGNGEAQIGNHNAANGCSVFVRDLLDGPVNGHVLRFNLKHG